jgi:hypothetical protein
MASKSIQQGSLDKSIAFVSVAGCGSWSSIFVIGRRKLVITPSFQQAFSHSSQHPLLVHGGGILAKHTIHAQTLLRGSLTDLPKSPSPHRCERVVALSESVMAATHRCHEKIETIYS